MVHAIEWKQLATTGIFDTEQPIVRLRILNIYELPHTASDIPLPAKKPVWWNLCLAGVL